MEPPSPPAAPPEATLEDTLLMGLGILLGLLGSVMINVGNNVQALGMGMEAAQKDLDEKEQSKRPKVLWTTGTVAFIVGSVINFVAFVFAAASVLAPLEAIQFVSNLVFARFVTKVPVSKRMTAGSALIIAGTIGAVAGGPLTVTSFTIADLRGFWRSPAWIAYVAFAWIASLSMQAFWEVQTRRTKANGQPCGPPALLPIVYSVSSALIGTQSVVQAKAFSELMEVWLGSDVNIWLEWFTYVVLAYFLVTVAFWLYRLNAALGMYDPLFIIPLLQASYIVLATVAGGLPGVCRDGLVAVAHLRVLHRRHVRGARPADAAHHRCLGARAGRAGGAARRRRQRGPRLSEVCSLDEQPQDHHDTQRKLYQPPLLPGVGRRALQRVPSVPGGGGHTRRLWRRGRGDRRQQGLLHRPTTAVEARAGRAAQELAG